VATARRVKGGAQDERAILNKSVDSNTAARLVGLQDYSYRGCLWIVKQPKLIVPGRRDKDGNFLMGMLPDGPGMSIVAFSDQEEHEAYIESLGDLPEDHDLRKKEEISGQELATMIEHIAAEKPDVLARIGRLVIDLTSPHYYEVPQRQFSELVSLFKSTELEEALKHIVSMKSHGQNSLVRATVQSLWVQLYSYNFWILEDIKNPGEIVWATIDGKPYLLGFSHRYWAFKFLRWTQGKFRVVPKTMKEVMEMTVQELNREEENSEETLAGIVVNMNSKATNHLLLLDEDVFRSISPDKEE